MPSDGAGSDQGMTVAGYMTLVTPPHRSVTLDSHPLDSDTLDFDTLVSVTLDSVSNVGSALCSPHTWLIIYPG